MATVLHAVGLEKWRGKRAILTDITLDVHGGEILTMLGPNGAGKSTLIALLAGLLRPDTGTVQLDGQPWPSCARHFLALAALTAPSVNSYRRLQPDLWSGAYACYGPDNREAAVRLCSPFRGRDMASMNLELRACDSSCNPYLALGGLLAAGMDGIIHQLHPGAPVIHHPMVLCNKACCHQGIQQLPPTLEAALAALQRDTVLIGALGDALTHTYLAVKRTEATAWREHAPEHERAQSLKGS